MPFSAYIKLIYYQPFRILCNLMGKNVIMQHSSQTIARCVCVHPSYICNHDVLQSTRLAFSHCFSTFLIVYFSLLLCIFYKKLDMIHHMQCLLICILRQRKSGTLNWTITCNCMFWEAPSVTIVF